MFIELNGISKSFLRPGRKKQEAVWAARNVSLGIAQGRMLALVGPSGSGKTTLLRCISGLETPDDGEIMIDGRTVFSAREGVDVPTEKRNLGLIFQSYALWPNMSVAGNVGYPLARRGIAGADRNERIKRYLDLVGCADLADRFPHELSGGQQQRIALARALVYEPAVVLFDEPLSNLDPTLREHLRAQIREIQRTVGFTGVYITHDQEEAFYVGDQVAILGKGEILQFGEPDQIYLRPETSEVAHFVGASNVCLGSISDDGTAFVCDVFGSVPLPDGSNHGAIAPGAPAKLHARPSAVRFDASGIGKGQAVVLDRVIMGGFQEHALGFGSDRSWRARSNIAEHSLITRGAAVAVSLDPDGVMVFPRERSATS